MMDPVLGKLRRVDARTVWKHEALAFTPWLRENIGLLGEALRIEIELIEREVRVGAYSADLVGKEVGTGREILIENQLEATDHGHLGQIITYAAGLDAKLVIWLSPQFHDEHRQALEWLNRQTPTGIAFFGVEFELLQIGDSALAPNFKIIAEPSEFQREASEAANNVISPRRVAYHGFFTDLLARLKAKNPQFTSASRAQYESWMSFSAGKAGFGFNPAFAGGGSFRVELYIDVGDVVANKAAFDSLVKDRQAIENAVGGNRRWEWERLDARRASRVSVVRDGSIDSPVDELDEFKDWAVDMLLAFRSVFTPRLSSLRLETAATSNSESSE